MKRSEINAAIRFAERLFGENGFRLPPFARWSAEEWRANRDAAAEIFAVGMGWDITDFGRGDFRKIGLTLFTARNGKVGGPDYPKTYAEKIMVQDRDQVTPFHYHAAKMEDIVNRGGGRLAIKLFQAADDNALSNAKIELSVDGAKRLFNPGDELILLPGESVAIPQRVYHRFTALDAPVMVGEVSMVNDDFSDNFFLEPSGRFPAIDEDETPYRFILGDYPRFRSDERRGRKSS